MTFSIVARCSRTGAFGLAISSSSPAVAARCAFARAGIGAVASQNVTDPRLGDRVLGQLANGSDATTAVNDVICTAENRNYRQILAVDNAGTTAIFSGSKALGINAECQSRGAAAAGNLLFCESVPQSMVAMFHEASGQVGDRLLAALRAGLDAGGEAGAVHSAGLLVVDKQQWPLVDLRCDWTTDCPIEAVAHAWQIYKPQMDDYVTRALSPADAPSYGVPGNE
ncbi:MAG: DUF1028 domain-containing protein [Alphaproteobacteria bacterium]